MAPCMKLLALGRDHTSRPMPTTQAQRGSRGQMTELLLPFGDQALPLAVLNEPPSHTSQAFQLCHCATVTPATLRAHTAAASVCLPVPTDTLSLATPRVQQRRDCTPLLRYQASPRGTVGQAPHANFRSTAAYSSSRGSMDVLLTHCCVSCHRTPVGALHMGGLVACQDAPGSAGFVPAGFVPRSCAQSGFVLTRARENEALAPVREHMGYGSPYVA